MKNETKIQFKLDRAVEKALITILKEYVHKMANVINLDEERLSNRVKYALHSENGRVPGLVNLISSITCWACEKGDESQRSINQDKLVEEMDIDVCLMEDIKEAKGYHSWISTDDIEDDNIIIEIIKGVNPDFDGHILLVEEFLESINTVDSVNDLLGIDIEEINLVNKSNPKRWAIKEKSIVKKIKSELEEIKIASEEYEATLSA